MATYTGAVCHHRLVTECNYSHYPSPLVLASSPHLCYISLVFFCTIFFVVFRGWHSVMSSALFASLFAMGVVPLVACPIMSVYLWQHGLSHGVVARRGKRTNSFLPCKVATMYSGATCGQSTQRTIVSCLSGKIAGEINYASEWAVLFGEMSWSP